MKNFINYNVFPFMGKMKRRISKGVVFPVLLMFFSFFGEAVAQCPTGDFTFSTQQAIDDFEATYSLCIDITLGNVTVAGSDITNLDGLSSITGITGDLWISGNDLLPNLDGLENLQTIGGKLYIEQNDVLTDMSGLSGLQSIGTNFIVYLNPQLTAISGLNNLTSVGADFHIDSNVALVNLNGLSNLTEIGGQLYIKGNSVLNDISGLTNIDPETIGGTFGLYIVDNPALPICNLPNFCTYLDDINNPRTISGNAGFCLDEQAVSYHCLPCQTGDYQFFTQTDIDTFGAMYAHCTDITLGNVTIDGSQIYNLNVLSNITAITGNLEIHGSTFMTDINGLSNLTTIGGNLLIDGTYYSSNLANIDLHSLTTVGGYIDINDNNVLTTLDLSGLNSVGGSFIVYLNPQLTAISGLTNLTSIGADFHIDSNVALVNLNGLSNLTQIGGQLYIKGNSVLNDISGLTNIDPETIGGTFGLYIVDNPALSICNLPNFCTYLDDENNPRTISGNAGFCLDEQAVIASCVPCQAGNYQFFTQADIDDFGIMYAHCTDIELNNVFIDGSNITNLNGLSNITTVTGNMHIQFNSVLTNLDGLNNITTVTGFLYIWYNPVLTNLDGLSSLTTVGNSFRIINNPELPNLDGLSNITTVGDNLQISGNTVLTTIDGLSGLASTGSLSVWGNPALTTIDGLSGLTSIESLVMWNNASLTNLDGLSNVTGITGDIYISSNPALTDISGLENVNPATITNLEITDNGLLSLCNLPNFCTYLADINNPRTINGNAGFCLDEQAVTASCVPCPTGDYQFFTQADIDNFGATYAHCTDIVLNNVTILGGNDIINLNGLSNITTVTGFLIIWHNPVLTNLDGLSSLTTVGGQIQISNNSALENIDGLSNLTSIEGGIYITSNSALTDISGLQNVNPATISNLEITNNGLLSLCNLPNFCTYLSDENNLRTISGNAGFCLNEQAVIASCVPCPTGNYSFYTQADIDNFVAMYPHCTNIVLNNVYFSSSITNLDGLSNITIVGGYLLIPNNSSLTNLDGLNGLTTVGGYFGIHGNTALENLDGLSSLTSIGSLDIYDNTVLTNIDGLSNVTSITGGHIAIVIENNSLLANLDGLSNVTNNPTGIIDILDNPVLTDISGFQNINLANITSLGIVNNPSLSLCNLPNLCAYLSNPSHTAGIDGNAGFCFNKQAVLASCAPCPTGDFTFTSQAQIDAFGAMYGYCTDITLNNVTIFGTGITNLDGLSSITGITGDLWISGNDLLPNLDGLENLQTIGADFHIDSNVALTNLNGLSNLTEIGGQLYINGNSVLNDISGLTNIDPETIGGTFGLYIVDNPALSVCNLPNFCTYLDDINNPRTISGNTGYCFELAVVDACTTCPTSADDFIFTTQEQIDDFADFAYCGNITLNNLTIEGNDITNLNGLSDVTTITGAIYIIGNPALTDISGLQNVNPATITNLEITNNGLLSVCNLPNFCTYLADVNNPRTISGNAGFCLDEQAVTAYCVPCPTGDYQFFTQADIDTFGAMYAHCTDITLGNVTIDGSQIFNLNVLSNITAITGNLEIHGSTFMTDINGLSNLTTIGGNLLIDGTYYSSNLANIDLHSLTTVGGYIDINDNNVLTTLDLSGLNSVGGSFIVYLNPQLTAISGLTNLTSVGADFHIDSNVALVNLNGLSNLTEIGGQLYIKGNSALSDISELQNIDPETITNLEITNNGLLSVCNLPNFCTYLDDVNNPRTISGNAGFCLDEQAVIASCAPCPTGDYFFDSQAEIDDFGTTYAHCTNITLNNVTISSTGITNLDGLSGLKNVEGYLKLENINTLTNTDGLSNLTTVGEYLWIQSINSTSTAMNLSSLTSVGEEFRIQDNNALTAIDLSSLTSVGDELRITNNSALTAVDLSGLTTPAAYIEISSNSVLANLDVSNLTTVGGLTIHNSPALTNLNTLSNLTTVGSVGLSLNNVALTDIDGLGNLTSVGGGLGIVSIPSLTHLDALSNLTTVGGMLEIGDNSNLTNLDGLSGLTSTGGINFSTNPALTDIDGLSNITTLGGYLRINDVDALTNLDALNTLTSIGGRIEITRNALLANLNGLSNVTSVQGEIRIGGFTAPIGNPQLTDISGLANIDPEGITKLQIRHNPLLSVCNLSNFCIYLSDENNTRTINNNGEDCVSYQAIEAACAGNCDNYTVWNGTEWSNQTPDTDKKAIINGNLTLTENIIACEILLASGILTVNPDVTLTVNGQIINSRTAENFVVESNANLIQVADVENMGEITVERESSPMFRLDYTLWSSPVSGMLLKNFSEVSPSGGYGTLWNRVYTLGENAWLQVWQDQVEFLADVTKTFTQAKGYLYRAKNDWVVRGNQNGDPAQEDLGIFKGIPQNGTINIAAPYLFNAIGNPYPSPVDADELWSGNEADALYFWTNTNVPVGETYASNNWAAYNGTGGTAASNGTEEPDGIIQTGQGFVVGFESANPSRQVTFDNTMRLTTHNGQFFRQTSNERHRFWLNLSNDEVVFNQILVGYLENATQGIDTGIDAKMFAYEGNAVYSIIENSEEKFVIQGRELPFTDVDIVPLGFRAVNAGSFSISLSNSDGIFEQGNTSIYLKDNLNQTQHNLNDGAYTFVSEEGVFDNRFEVVYQTTMSIQNPDLHHNWIVYKQNNTFQVLSQGFELKEVSVYDMLGRKIYTSAAEGTAHHIPALGAEGVFIVKVTTTEDKILNKKVR